MVYQVRAGYQVFGREIKVPQQFIPGVMRVIVFGKTQYLTDVLNTFHAYAGPTPITAAMCNTLATAIDNWVSTDYKACFSSEIRYEGTHVRGMDALVTGQATVATNAGQGSLASDPLPPYVSLPTVWTTGQTGHGSHGMWHTWFPTEGQNDPAGDVANAYINSVDAAMADLLSVVAVAGFIPVVASFQYRHVTDIVGHTTRNYWGSVVSRKVAHGR